MPARARINPCMLGGWLLVAFAMLVALAQTGCSTASARPGPRPRPAGPITPIESRVDHVLGTTLVMPVTVRPNLAKPGPVEALLEDGRSLDARLAWVAIDPDPAEFNTWLPPAGRWSVVSAPLEGVEGASPTPIGSWAVVVSIPIDAAGQGIWIAGGLIDLNWITPLPLEPGDRLHAALAPVFPGAGASPGFASLIEPEYRSPARRWRARLVSEGLPPPPELSTEAPERTSVLDALAAQQEARWRAALLRLAEADPDACERVRRALCAVVTLESGVMAPAWPVDPQPMDRLLSSLLAPGARERDRVRAAEEFLDTRPPGVAWVVDDAGLIDAATNRSLATLGVVNLGERATLSWASPTGADVAPTLEPLSPLKGTLATTLARRTVAPNATQPVGEVTANVGRWSATRLALTEPLIAAPPGLRAGPLLPPWTLASWLAGVEPRSGLADAPWATAALLERLPGASGAWTLYVECLRPPEQGNDADSVRLWFGPRSRPAAVIRVSRAGSVTDEVALETDAMLVGNVTQADDRWAFRVTVPRRAIDADGTLMLGIERLAPGGRRWAWPRPMTPWQVEPGRARIDLSAWDGIQGR